MGNAFAVLILIFLVWLWLDGSRARELATGHGDELLARLQAIVRRRGDPASSTLVSGDVALDADNKWD